MPSDSGRVPVRWIGDDSAAESVGPALHALYPLAFRRRDRFGACVGVRLPEPGAADRAMLLGLLHPDERRLAVSFKGARLVEWIGGRIASRLARGAILAAPGPTLIGPGGAPAAEAGVSLSLSHTRGLAVALAGAAKDGAVGVDIEPAGIEAANERLLAERILSRDEPEADIATVQRLSIKEAVYKAVFALTGESVPLRTMIVGRLGGETFAVTIPIEIPIEGVRVETSSTPFEDSFLSLAHCALTVTPTKAGVRRKPRQRRQESSRSRRQ